MIDTSEVALMKNIAWCVAFIFIVTKQGVLAMLLFWFEKQFSGSNAAFYSKLVCAADSNQSSAGKKILPHAPGKTYQA